MEMPLFPLNVVLFPGWPMPLHIFEPRYLEMVRTCVNEKKPFGVVLIKEGQPEFDIAVEPHDIGCSVAITQVEKLEDGRLLIMTVGQERFRILSLRRDRPYLVGEVEPLPFTPENPEPLHKAARHLHPLVVNYLTTLTELVDDIEFDTSQVPTQPEALSYMAAALLQIPLETKQSLLEARRVSSLLKYLYGVYQQEIDLLKRFPSQNMGTFSVN